MKIVHLFAALILFCATAAAADPWARTISVTGTGEVSAIPDMVNVTVGVRASEVRSTEAMAALTTQMRALFRVLEQAGVPERDVQTQNLRLNPIYADNKRTRIRGYEATNTVRITLRSIQDLGPLLDGLTQSGANIIQGISFDISDRAGLMIAARKAAVADAKARATLYATEAGVTLGAVLSIAEGGSSAPRPEFARAMVMADAASLPVAGGEMSLSASVSMTFALK